MQARPWRRVQRGDRVRVVMGSLEGCRGTVVGLAGNCRVVLLLDGFENGVRVILPFEAVELVVDD